MRPNASRSAPWASPRTICPMRYECQKCKDSGYVGLKMCDCMRRALIKEAYETSGLGAVLTEQSFANFDLTYYSDHPDANGISARDRMTKILAEAQAYVRNFDADFRNRTAKNLLFIGKTGLGKTHISTAIAGGVINAGYDVVYDTVQNILHNFEVQTFAKNSDASSLAAASTERYLNCSLLIIDDLGTGIQKRLYRLHLIRITQHTHHFGFPHDHQHQSRYQSKAP